MGSPRLMRVLGVYRVHRTTAMIVGCSKGSKQSQPCEGKRLTQRSYCSSLQCGFCAGCLCSRSMWLK